MRSGQIQEAQRLYRMLEAAVGEGGASVDAIALLLQLTASLILALAKSGDLKSALDVYRCTRDRAAAAAALPGMCGHLLVIAFNAMYVSLESDDLDQARPCFADISTLAKNGATRAPARPGWGKAAANWVMALAKAGQTAEALQVLRELVDAACADYDPDFGNDIANVANRLLAGHGGQPGRPNVVRDVAAQLEVLTLQQPDDRMLRMHWFRTRGGLIAPNMPANLADEITGLLEEVREACNQDWDDVEMQETLLKMTANAVMAFASLNRAELSTRYLQTLENPAGFPGMEAEVPYIRCVAGLHVFLLQARQGLASEAARTFLVINSAIEGDPSESTAGKNEARVLMELFNEADHAVALEIYQVLVHFAERHRPEKRLRQILVFSALGPATNPAVSEPTRSALSRLLLRLPEAFPDESELKQGLKVMAGLDDLLPR